MNILIPVERDIGNASKIASLSVMGSWAVVVFTEGAIESMDFFEDRTQTNVGWIDFVILSNKFENYLEFMEEGMMVLVPRGEETLEEIMEAFKFKELDEIGF